MILLLIASSGFVYHQSLPVHVGEDGSGSIIEDLLVSVSDSVSETKKKSAPLSSNKEQDTLSSSFSWESPHLLDCHRMTTSTDDTITDANEIFVATKTEPSFLMNIHNPKIDQVSKTIQTDGCWECNHVQEMLNALNKYPIPTFLISAVTLECGLSLRQRRKNRPLRLNPLLKIITGSARLSIEIRFMIAFIC